MGAVQQRVQFVWKILAFFPRKMSPAQQKHNAYDRDLLAIYETEVLTAYAGGPALHHPDGPQTTHFRVPPQETNAHRASSTTWTLSRNSPDVRHVSGQDNVADTCSRDDIISAPVCHDAPAAAQVDEDELRTLLVISTALQFKKKLLSNWRTL
jgi:hypothetical protein